MLTVSENARSYKFIRGGGKFISRNSLALAKRSTITYDQVIKLLNEHGFVEVRRTQGHVFLRHEKSESLITLPTHAKEVRPAHMAVVRKVLGEIK